MSDLSLFVTMFLLVAVMALALWELHCRECPLNRKVLRLGAVSWR